jgi:HEAT repeat protein
MVDDPSTESFRIEGNRATLERRRRVVAAGHRGDLETIEAARGDSDGSVRAARLGALERAGALSANEVVEALGDPDAVVRHRAAIVAARAGGRGSRSSLPRALVESLGDPDPLVAEAAAWVLGERSISVAVPELAAMAANHDDPRCRESAVAALGSIGDPDGLGAVLGALDDRPTVRRRAVIALVGFEAPEVEPALERCLKDPDWQVRQAAEVLLER